MPDEAVNKREKSRAGWIFCFCCLVLVAAMQLTFFPRANAETTLRPAPAQKPLDGKGHMVIGPLDRCPVCGMKVIKYPRFAAAIQLKNKTTYYFCSNRCMLRSWLKPDIFLASEHAKLSKPVIQEYFYGQHLDARQVIWVSGSDIIGPMGPALIPLRDDDSLKAFRERHGGQTVFRLNNLNSEARNAIERKRSAP
jgi:nitrous oxide reductase accessory protein NosL